VIWHKHLIHSRPIHIRVMAWTEECVLVRLRVLGVLDGILFAGGRFFTICSHVLLDTPIPSWLYR
jgi:hypothetical protein